MKSGIVLILIFLLLIFLLYKFTYSAVPHEEINITKKMPMNIKNIPQEDAAKDDIPLEIKKDCKRPRKNNYGSPANSAAIYQWQRDKEPIADDIAECYRRSF